MPQSTAQLVSPPNASMRRLRSGLAGVPATACGTAVGATLTGAGGGSIDAQAARPEASAAVSSASRRRPTGRGGPSQTVRWADHGCGSASPDASARRAISIIAGSTTSILGPKRSSSAPRARIVCPTSSPTGRPSRARAGSSLRAITIVGPSRRTAQDRGASGQSQPCAPLPRSRRTGRRGVAIRPNRSTG